MLVITESLCLSEAPGRPRGVLDPSGEFRSLMVLDLRGLREAKVGRSGCCKAHGFHFYDRIQHFTGLVGRFLKS